MQSMLPPPENASPTAAGMDAFTGNGRYGRTTAIMHELKGTLRDEHCCHLKANLMIWQQVEMASPTSAQQPCMLRMMRIYTEIAKMRLTDSLLFMPPADLHVLPGCLPQHPGVLRHHCAAG